MIRILPALSLSYSHRTHQYALLRYNFHSATRRLSSSSNSEFNGKIAIITGAASGIGLEVAKDLSHAGASIAAVDISSENLARIQGQLSVDNQIHQFFSLDVSQHNQVRDLVEEVSSVGDIAMVINCAGITRDDWLINMKLDDWESVQNVNLKGPFLLTQAVAAKRVEKYQIHEMDCYPLSIVNIASIIGKVGNLGQANYAASKAGLVGFTKSAAKELARYNTRVNCVLPGFIETPMSQAVPEKVKNKLLPTIPLQRFGLPKEVSNAVLFLVSQKSSYITGGVLEVTGGMFM